MMEAHPHRSIKVTVFVTHSVPKYSALRVQPAPVLVTRPYQVDLLDTEYGLPKRAQMLETVYSVRHAFQYMVDPVHELVSVDKAWEVHCMDDAFTMSLKALVGAG